ncbi:heavy metal translocating P-type ATPase [Cohnella sp. CIP 111063]|uniref:heavy metal translocating P-type ATPase n=1 Tax=unclassified Cohnella TaxID=2636738 RepID=UPI000B8C18D5|nr:MULTISPECIES: heavy metal translocating P-type ATPase [unclassified Cohnella]OXS59975.1 heavy metal translocating P-type ATPase [Cohnella sp. CIP 111063]PRX72787.1 Cd2+/Zn2+-exporting ATPase [Cohnella sp. SGD-V74]
MQQTETDNNEKQVYRVQGFTCTNCAGKFENNVKALPGVADAQVNFGASKITVFGQTTVDDLEKAGAFENLKVTPEKQRIIEKREPLWKENWNVIVSVLLMASGYLLSSVYGEEDLIPALMFGAAIIIGGYELFLKGIKNLFRLQFDMNTLMTVAIIGAAAIGEWSEGAIVVVLFAISEALERYSMHKARQSIRSLMDIAPKEALVRRGSTELMVDVDAIQVGDIMIVKPGQKLAMDGMVVKGTSTINQAAITGESVPVTKTIDDEVFAGTLNEEGLLEVKVTKRVEDTTISKIIHLVEEAQAERAPSQAFVDRFAKYYTPAIMAIAVGIAVIPPLFGADWGDWIYRGLSLLVVGCPCALVISTPISIVTAIGNAAKNGVLIKGGIHLEEAGRITAVAFDKTGTLTKGFPEVTDISVFGGRSELELLSIAAVIEKGSQHPLASSIVRKAEQVGADLSLSVDDFQSITGKGVKASVRGELYYIGSPNLFEELHSNVSDTMRENILALQTQGKTVMVLGTNQDIISLIAVADAVRDSSKAVIEELHSIGVQKTIMLTGDNQATADAIGKHVGVAEVKAELLPQDKLEYIKQLRKSYSSVAMVGDGVNDAPALAASTVGIAMGGAGTDTALETADIALMADDLRKLPYTIRLSQKALAIIKQNVAFSLGIKLLALVLIVPGWLTLWLAILADMGATLLVTLNSLRLLKIKNQNENR